MNAGAAVQVFGLTSVYGFALVALVVLLAVLVMRSPEPLNVRWRPADLWRRAVRSSQARWRRIRRRIDLLLVQMLGDVHDQRQARPSERPPAKPKPGAKPAPDPVPGRTGPTAGAYQSKHRLAGPPKESQNPDSQTPRPAPRHAAPPAR